MWTKKIEIKDVKHCKEIVKALERIGEKVYHESYTATKSLWYDDNDDVWHFSSYSINSDWMSDYYDTPEYEIITKTLYELKEVKKREVIKIGDNEYFKDELEIALKNIKPISKSV